MSTAAWARRQHWVNGRFVEVDPTTGEVLGEHTHKHYPRSFTRDWRSESPERMTTIITEAPAAVDDLTTDGIKWIDGQWIERKGDTMKRVYTQAERKEAVRLYHEELWRPARIAEKMDIPRDKIRNWVHHPGTSLMGA